MFPGEPRLAGFIEAKDDGNGGDHWSYRSCKAPVKSLAPLIIIIVIVICQPRTYKME